MKRVDDLTRGALFGALAGLVGGVVFGAAMAELGVLPSVASIVRVESSVAGFVVNIAVAASVGSGLGALTCDSDREPARRFSGAWHMACSGGSSGR